MSLTIHYIDTQRQHEVECDEIQEKAILDFVKADMILPQDFNLLVIDLRDESIDRVTCYHHVHLAERTRICEFGGASAWCIYRVIASIWPTIDYYLPCFEGRAEHTS